MWAAGLIDLLYLLLTQKELDRVNTPWASIFFAVVAIGGGIAVVHRGMAYGLRLRRDGAFGSDQRRGTLRCRLRQHGRSVAEARKINAEAVAQEIQNSVDYVKAYYERRHIYEEEYRKKHPDAITVENRRQKMLKERVEKQYQAIMRGGDRSMTDMLNWLLQELSSSVMSLQYVLDEKGLPQRRPTSNSASRNCACFG